MVSHSTTIIANNTFFSASMIGTAIQINYDTLYLGNGSSTLTLNPAISSSTNRIPITSSNYTVLTVTDPYTASITPVTYNLYSGNPHIVAPTTYTASKILGSVTSLSSSTAYQYYTTVYSASVLLQKSYADIVFRNIDTFTGCVASQKLYAMKQYLIPVYLITYMYQVLFALPLVLPKVQTVSVVSAASLSKLA